jgi:hypothetical protein
MKTIRKLVFSDLSNPKLKHNVLIHQLERAKKIWDNSSKKKSKAIGTERILKLGLIYSQFFFPSIYIRAFFGKFGLLHKHIGVEMHVFLKLFISFSILFFELFKSNYSFVGLNIIEIWCFWMILETIFYTATLIFCEDIFAKPHSHKRNLIMIIIDYITLNLDLAIIYLITKSLKTTVQHYGQSIEMVISNAYDAVYFTFITSLTIGYGDITPTQDGRGLVLFQSLIMLLFGILFLNFYISRVSSK